jgi:hypothetical protein
MLLLEEFWILTVGGRRPSVTSGTDANSDLQRREALLQKISVVTAAARHRGDHHAPVSQPGTRCFTRDYAG